MDVCLVQIVECLSVVVCRLFHGKMPVYRLSHCRLPVCFMSYHHIITLDPENKIPTSSQRIAVSALVSLEVCYFRCTNDVMQQCINQASRKIDDGHMLLFSFDRRTTNTVVFSLHNVRRTASEELGASQGYNEVI